MGALFLLECDVIVHTDLMVDGGVLICPVVNHLEPAVGQPDFLRVDVSGGDGDLCGLHAAVVAVLPAANDNEGRPEPDHDLLCASVAAEGPHHIGLVAGGVGVGGGALGVLDRKSVV